MKSNKLLFIIPTIPEYAPYVYNYFAIADEKRRIYDVICWDRFGDGKSMFPSNYIVYQHPTSARYSPLRKLYEIYGFCKFVFKSVRKKNYDIVFTFTIADSFLFARWLSRYYKGRFVFDIRDYSPLIDNHLFRRQVNLLLRSSYINVISSNGFRSWLPDNYDYIICHNTDLGKVRKSIRNDEYGKIDGKLKILTIGHLRDVDANCRVIDAFANYPDVELCFVGGGVSGQLKTYCDEHRIANVEFIGRYHKEEEDDIVRECNMINIILPHSIKSDYLLSNRFYLSVRFRKPMIVNEGCYQAEIVNQYGLGLVVNTDTTLHDKVITYWHSIDWEKYNEGCGHFLNDVCKEMDEFRSKVEHLIS